MKANEVEPKEEEDDSEIQRMLSKGKESIELQFYKMLLSHIRLPLIQMKSLITEIKFSGFFDDQKIFEAL